MWRQINDLFSNDRLDWNFIRLIFLSPYKLNKSSFSTILVLESAIPQWMISYNVVDPWDGNGGQLYRFPPIDWMVLLGWWDTAISQSMLFGSLFFWQLIFFFICSVVEQKSRVNGFLYSGHLETLQMVLMFYKFFLSLAHINNNHTLRAGCPLHQN